MPADCSSSEVHPKFPILQKLAAKGASMPDAQIGRSRPSPPCVVTKSTTASRPSPDLRLVNTNGRSPRMRCRVARHHLEAGTDQRGQIDLVDDEQIGAGDARTALARDLVAGRDVDDVDRQIGQFGREGRRQIVAARFDQHDVDSRKQPGQLGDRREVDRSVLADCGMRTAAGLDAADPLRRQAPLRVRNSASSRV